MYKTTHERGQGNDRKKKKLVTFNIFRPTLLEYSGINRKNQERFDFNILLEYIKDQSKTFLFYIKTKNWRYIV